MFNFIKKLKLAFRSEEEILTELGRIYFNIKDEPVPLTYMSTDDKMDILRKSYEFVHSLAFKKIFAELRQSTINSTIQDAANLNHFLCGKMTVHGITLVEKKILELASIYEQETKSVKQDFDEFSLM